MSSFVERLARLALCSAIFLVLTSHLSAQVTATAPPLSVTLADYNNRWDAFGGVGYARFNTTVGHALRSNMLGFKLQATGWLSPVVGLTASTGNYYGSVSLPSNSLALTSASISEHMFLFGPEFRVLRDPKYAASLHVLVGGTYGIFDSSFSNANVEPNFVNLPNNQLAFAAAAGATMDYNISPQWAGRLIVDFQPTRYGLAFQQDVAASIGVVYKWGTIRK